jgi:hypothetical protein
LVYKSGFTKQKSHLLHSFSGRYESES